MNVEVTNLNDSTSITNDLIFKAENGVFLKVKFLVTNKHCGLG